MVQNKRINVTQASMPPYEEYIEAIKPLWNTHWMTNMGRYHFELEKQLKEYLNVPELSLVVNGHMALELVIQSFGFPEGAEVITTPFTFISTTHAIVRNRLKPVFCDIKMNDGTIDEEKITSLITRRTVAIVPVHVYGHICNVDAIKRIADEYNLKVIYDAAHAFGVKYKGIGIGNYGDASIFSFHATKIYNTIEGGAVTFSDCAIYEKLYNLKNFGIKDEETIVDIGANAKMNEFAAIMGLCNLRHVEETLQLRKMKYHTYKSFLSNTKGIRIFDNKVQGTENYSYFPVLVEAEYRMSRDELFEYLREEGIYTRKYFYPLTSEQKCYRGRYEQEELTNAKEISKRILCLPFYADLEDAIIKKITDMING